MRSIRLKPKLDENIHFRVTKEQLTYLDFLSKKYNCTIPQLLRIIIDSEISKIKSEGVTP